MKNRIFKNCLLFCTLFSALNIGLFANDQEKNLLQRTEEEYQKGEYDAFLDELNAEYSKAEKDGVLGRFLQEMKAARQDNSSILNRAFQGIEQSNIELEKERDLRLNQICNEDPAAEICKKVQSALNSPLTEKQKEALSFLASLSTRIPDQDDQTPENQLASIEMEYQIKVNLWQIALLQKNQKANLDVKKQLAAEFEKFAKMEKVASTFEDPKWLHMIQDAKKGYQDSFQSRKDAAYLRALGMGKIQPNNAIEEQVRDAMKTFIDKQQKFES